jgi:hypothetical protein
MRNPEFIGNQNSQEKKAMKGEPGKDCHDRTANTGLKLGQTRVCKEKTAGIGLPGQDWQDRIDRT